MKKEDTKFTTENADIRLIATDIDGTLLDSGGTLSGDFYPCFASLRARDILFALASGRQYFNLQKQFRDIEQDTLFIAENGAYIVYRGQDIHVQALDRKVVTELITIARKIGGADIILCGKKNAYIENTDPAFMAHVVKYYERREVVKDLLDFKDDEFLKIAICDPLGSEAHAYPHFRPFEDQLQVKVSGSVWLDLSHKLANKGRALEVLQEKYGINMEQTMAFGDYLNDLEMMQQAWFSFAMANAHPEVKKAARFIAGSNDEEGVVKILREILKTP